MSNGPAYTVETEKDFFRSYDMTIRAASILISLIPPVIFLFGCASTKYVPIENPSERIISGCISMLPPAEGEWYVDKHWTEMLYGPDPCEDRLRLASGDEEDLYFIYITTGLRKWSDKLDNEYLRNWVKNYHDRELIKNKKVSAPRPVIISYHPNGSSSRRAALRRRSVIKSSGRAINISMKWSNFTCSRVPTTVWIRTGTPSITK